MPISRTLRTQCHIKDISLIISFLFFLYLLLHHHRSSSTLPSFHTTTTTSLISNSSNTTTTPTTLRHILFSIASSSDTLPKRNDYIRLWYKPNSTRAYLFLDRPTPISSLSTTTTTLLPTLIYGNTSKFPYTFQGGQRYAIRIARIVKQAVEQNDSAVRWFVFSDDDTVFFTENLVQTLAKYDHDRWFYVGTNSERYELNEYFSFDMGFGGAGFAISHSLAGVLARVLDSCLMRYPHLYSSDARVFSCLAELGVELTHESGFHQVDLLGNLFGMLSSLPLSPLVSLHHLDLVDPIFPNMTRTRALEHLFEVANVDPARILQQTVCYDPLNSFTVSVAWGYAVQVFEGNHLLPDLLSVEETFKSWEKKGADLNYMFKTREQHEDPCKRPAVFYFKSAVSGANNRVWTYYIGHNTVGNCSQIRVRKNFEEIRVFSEKLDIGIGQVKALRRQCCDIIPSYNKLMTIDIRQCRDDELIAMPV